MEIKNRGITFRNTYRYNNKITIETFNIIIDKSNIDYKNNKGKTFYLVESIGFYSFTDAFGDITNYTVDKKTIEDINYLKVIGD
jgi:hypothetical protein